MNTSVPLNGDVIIEGDTARLFFQRQLPHPPERVWSALTDPVQLKQWMMAASFSVEARVGGQVASKAGPSQIAAHGKILTWDPPRVFEYEWISEPRTEMPAGEDSVVRWELAPFGGGTRLTLEHRRLTRSTGTGFGPGWHAFLDRLDALLEGRPLPEWLARFNALKVGYPGWAE